MIAEPGNFIVRVAVSRYSLGRAAIQDLKFPSHKPPERKQTPRINLSWWVWHENQILGYPWRGPTGAIGRAALRTGFVAPHSGLGREPHSKVGASLTPALPCTTGLQQNHICRCCPPVRTFPRLPGEGKGAPCCSAAPYRPRPTTKKSKTFIIHPREDRPPSWWSCWTVTCAYHWASLMDGSSSRIHDGSTTSSGDSRSGTR